MVAFSKKATKGANPLAPFPSTSSGPLAPFPHISLYRAVYRWANPLAPFVAPFPYFVALFASRGKGGHLAGSWASYRRRPSGSIAPPCPRDVAPAPEEVADA